MSNNLPAPTQAPGSPRRTDVMAALLGGKTFRSLSEQTLSPREEKFERARQTLGFFLAPAVAVVFALLPTAMDPTQQLLAAILLGVIILWICESVPIPVGGLIGVAAVVILGVAPASDVLRPFGSTTIFTFIGAFILAQAMLKHGIAQRLAFAVLSIPGVPSPPTASSSRSARSRACCRPSSQTRRRWLCSCLPHWASWPSSLNSCRTAGPSRQTSTHSACAWERH